jgi:Zn-dependent peptidase ImmA (M78 family)
VELPAYAARLVLDELRITSPEDLLLLDLIAFDRGAVVQEEHLDGPEARIALGSEKAIITVSTTIQDPRRRRFSVAHELGHLEMHRWHEIMVLCKKEDIVEGKEPTTTKDKEREANEFAASLLLPERFFVPLCEGAEPSLGLVRSLADGFFVSRTATARRYMHFCREPCVVVFSQQRIMQWFEASHDFKELGLYLPIPGPLHPDSVAGRFFLHGVRRDTPKRVGAACWFESGKYRDGATVLEQSWAMPRHNAVLTLLWVDNDITDDRDYWEYED